MTQNAKLQAPRARASSMQAAARARILCGPAHAQTRGAATTKSRRFSLAALRAFFSVLYKPPRLRFSRQFACTLLGRVCTTIERNEGCSHVSQETYSRSPPYRRGDSSRCTCAICLDCLSRLAPTPACHGAPSPSPAERTRTKHRASLFQRGGLRGSRLVRRPT